MKVGITLPQFREDAGPAVAAARAAEEAGLDGVFVFDHLWPMGQPDRPALYSFALLGALAVETSRVAIGTLVARVGLLPDAVLVHALETVERMCDGRLIAGLGVGDRLSAAENLAFAVPYTAARQRLDALVGVCRDVHERGITTWVGGRSAEVHAIAREGGYGLNLWGVDAARIASVDDVEITWGGQVGPEVDVADHLRKLADAGATWAVCAPTGQTWSDAIAALAAAKKNLEAR